MEFNPKTKEIYFLSNMCKKGTSSRTPTLLAELKQSTNF